MGQRNGFSDDDVDKINLKYKCSAGSLDSASGNQRPIFIDTNEESKPSRPNRPFINFLAGRDWNRAAEKDLGTLTLAGTLQTSNELKMNKANLPKFIRIHFSISSQATYL